MKGFELDTEGNERYKNSAGKPSARSAFVTNGELRLYDLHNKIQPLDDFGIPTIWYKGFEITLEKSNLGIQCFIRRGGTFWGRSAMLGNVTVASLFGED